MRMTAKVGQVVPVTNVTGITIYVDNNFEPVQAHTDRAHDHGRIRTRSVVLFIEALDNPPGCSRATESVDVLGDREFEVPIALHGPLFRIGSALKQRVECVRHRVVEGVPSAADRGDRADVGQARRVPDGPRPSVGVGAQQSIGGDGACTGGSWSTSHPSISGGS